MASKIKGSIDAIIKLVEYIKQHGFFKITKIVLEIALWILIILGAVNYERVFKVFYDTAQEISITEHAKLMNHRLLITDDVNNIVAETYKKVGANKGWIFEFHNGNKNLTGMPFYFMDMTYEQLNSERTIPTKSNWIDVSLSYYPFVAHAYDIGYYVGKVDDIMELDELFAYKLKSENVKYIAALLLYGNREPIGIIGVSSEMPFNGTDKYVLNELSKAAQHIIPLLDTSLIK